MNLNLFKRTLKDRFKATSMFSLGLFLYSWLVIYMIPIYPIAELMKAMERFPTEFLGLVAGGGLTMEILATTEGFISMEYLSLWWLIIVAGYSFSSAIGVVAKEMEDGTLETLLAQPLRRWEIITTRYLVNIIYLLFLAYLSVGVMWFFAQIYEVSIKTEGLMVAGFAGFLFFLLMFSFALFLSILLKEGGKAIMISIAVFIISHLINGFADFSKMIEKFRFLSIFNYYKPYEYLSKGTINWQHSLIFILFILLFSIGSLLAFKKKDISVV